METLISEQEVTLELIKKIGVNFRKSSKSRLKVATIQVKVETLNEYWTKFRTTHFSIVQIATSEQKLKHKYFAIDMFGIGEEEYINTKSDMLEKIEELSEKAPESLEKNITHNQTQEVKLPKINIPQFSGNYHDWSTFRDLYTRLIHNNHSLSKVQKLHYLKSSITGEAEQLLRQIQITERNYDVAWETLNNRYNNRRIIVQTILNRLFNQRKLSQSTAKGIKDLLDTTVECLNSLKNNDVETTNWDIIVIHLIVNKLDDESHKQWEEDVGELPIDILPTFERFTKFLETRFRVYEMMCTTSVNVSRERNASKTKSFITTNNTQHCPFCKQDHRLSACTEFAKLDVNKRIEHIQNERLCFNCLSPSHSVIHCRSKASCHECRKRHHTLIHLTRTERESEPNRSENTTIETPTTSESRVIRSHLTVQGKTALLATALVNIETSKGPQTLRALIDPCSQESFVNEITVKRLQLRRRIVEGEVSGVDQMTSKIKYATELEITSRLTNAFKINCTAFVVKQITDFLPTSRVKNESFSHIQHLTLADPTYMEPGTIDLLLGVNVFTEIIMSGVIKGSEGSPIAQQTQFGWIISGGGIKENITRGIVSMHLNVKLEKMLEKFWEDENVEIRTNTSYTVEELRAEQIYENTTIREPNGRYVVALPFKHDEPNLPTHTYERALDRFKRLEKKLSQDEKLSHEYNKVMREYLTLNHMEPVKERTRNERAIYLPHHAVLREDKITTKVRVVFDASSKGSNNISLNDELLIGPPLQEELRSILMRWRIHKICFTADIIKMYRQIRLRKEDTDYHRILWRFSDEEEIQDYRLLTVTFGTACAPYLAIKTLKQVAIDGNKDESLQEAQRAILNDFFVDDILSGSYDIETAIDIQSKVTKILQSGGFELQKWNSNSKQFMEEIENSKRASKNEIEPNIKDTTKTLGINWNTLTDKLQITNTVHNSKILLERTITKRKVLTVIASLFDPMGWLAPSIIVAKIFMQKLWAAKIAWDDELPASLRNEWCKYNSQLNKLFEINVDRWMGTSNTHRRFELHGFSDASAAAYAAVVYARVVQSNDEIKVSLIISKTKVAPLKQVALPRLELCAALLLTKLLKHVATALRVDETHTYAWSDSQVALCWINGDPNRWKPYVKNRVIEISNTFKPNWSYIPTKENPADPASRGVAPEKLKSHELWWQGPLFLKDKYIKRLTCEVPTTLELKETVSCMTVKSQESEDVEILTLLTKYSSLRKLITVIAYCRRWLHLKNKDKVNTSFINFEEREEALTVCLKLSQGIEFRDEIENLKRDLPLQKKSRLLSLKPFLDENEVLRVGGRLKHAHIQYQSKHPVIISKTNVLLPLLLADAHYLMFKGLSSFPGGVC
ncbi:uncharacterized protein LOC123721012 [Papilio machaon]|uniref:uncharacterized protein LOC123721012 n=1 Tax=Papilio machaon TaxID=76193 RepID=UPI001E663F52|nr:uncharacterized protein LOC123721012 [Papilio machaon]